jgi:hypothetical protein
MRLAMGCRGTELPVLMEGRIKVRQKERKSCRRKNWRNCAIPPRT